jgi:2-polyprenyl-3-methyl-5-hydroxy-6-metoxy-1,4-benzoquinol methylase
VPPAHISGPIWLGLAQTVGVFVEEKLAYSMALDLLFNGQNMDYGERPLSISAIESMAVFSELKDNSHVCVIGPGGGRLVRTLADRGHTVEAFEGRQECLDHLKEVFEGHKRVQVAPMSAIEDPLRAAKKKFDAMFCMDDLRAFREDHNWTRQVEKMLRSRGYFVYSQVSNKLPGSKNPLSDFCDLVGDYNVSEETAREIRECYLSLDYWRPSEKDRKMAGKTLQMVESASSLRRSIMSGVEVHYVVWRKKK